MGALIKKINYLKNTKSLMKEAIQNKGVIISDTDTFRDYATKVANISTEGGNVGEYLELSPTSSKQFVSLIKKIPDIDTSVVTNMSSMFSDCTSLITIPLLNTSAVTNMSSMFSRCSSLKTIPELNTSAVTNMGSMFSSCSSLTTIPELDTSQVTQMSVMFQGCSSLIAIPQLDASKVTYMIYAFLNCSSLTTFGGLLNLGRAYSTSQSASYRSYTLDLSSCTSLTHDSLMNVINNLYDIATKGCNVQSLTLGPTNLAKLTAEEIAIATNKGWTVS